MILIYLAFKVPTITAGIASPSGAIPAGKNVFLSFYVISFD